MTLEEDNKIERNNKIIEVNDLDFAYKTKEGWLDVLKSVNFSVESKEFVSIIGPSGCGKTTLLKLIGGILNPFESNTKVSGSIKIQGHPVDHARRNREFGFVFQNPVLLPWRNVRNNIMLPLEIIGKKINRTPWDITQLLELVGLKEFQWAYSQQLSGGMAQRVALARALVFKPSILLMDEPLGALDTTIRERMQHELLRIWMHTGATVVFVTHSLEEAVFLSDRILIMSARPSSISKEVRVEFPRPRLPSLKENESFYKITKLLKECLNKNG